MAPHLLKGLFDTVAGARVLHISRKHVACSNPSAKDFYLGMTLRYPCEVREANAYFDEIPIGRFLAASSCNFKV